MKNFKMLGIFFIVTMTFFISGCGSRENEADKKSTSSIELMWKTDGFVTDDEVVKEQELWIDRYIRWEHDDVELLSDDERALETIEGGALQDCIYRFTPVNTLSEFTTVRVVMECIDTVSMEKKVTLFLPEQIGAGEDNSGFVCGVNAAVDGSYIFHWLKYGYDGDDFVQKANELVYLTEDSGKVETNLLPAYIEKGLIREKYNSIVFRSQELSFDVFGNSYVIGDNSDSLFVLDMDGKNISEYYCSAGEQIGKPMNTEDGELIFPCYNKNDKTTSLLWVDVKNENIKTLATINDIILQLYGLKENNLYYENNDGIIRWDVTSGTRKLIFEFKENGVLDVYKKQLVLRSDDTTVLRMYGQINGEFEDWLLVMSDKPVDKNDPVRVVSLTNESNRVKTCARVAARKNPEYSYKYEDKNGIDETDFYARIMAELMSGQGPDILYVSAENMELLGQKGLLADLRGYISEESLNKVIPGVLKLGMDNGVLIGIASDITATSLMIRDDVWNGDSWTPDDMLSLLEDGRISGRLFDGGTLHASRISIKILLEYLLADSFVIDWEKNESHFEDERFIKLIEYLGNCQAEQLDEDDNKPSDALILTSISSLDWINYFTGIRGNTGWHYVGFPSRQGCGNYLEAGGMLVVNAATTANEAVAAYLECFLGREVQDAVSFGEGMPIIPLPTENVVFDEDKAYWQGQEMPLFDDGSTSLDEVNDLLEKCVPAPKKYPQIEQIVWEELEAYYSGGKTAEETASVIDDRVQIYLDELQ